MQNFVTTKFRLISYVTVSSYMTLEVRPSRTHNIGERRNSGVNFPSNNIYSKV